MQLLDDYISADGLTIVIGSEHSAPDLQRFSLVVSSYSTDGTDGVRSASSAATRMRYSKAINAVDSLSRAINRMVGSSTCPRPGAGGTLLQDEP